MCTSLERIYVCTYVYQGVRYITSLFFPRTEISVFALKQHSFKFVDLFTLDIKNSYKSSKNAMANI